MSPLVALLALACAAPLTAQPQNCYEAIQRGQKTTYEIKLPPVIIDGGIHTFNVDIPDACALKGSTLVGVSIKVCDLTPTVVTMPSQYPFSPAIIHRNYAPNYPVTILVTEYCV